MVRGPKSVPLVGQHTVFGHDQVVANKDKVDLSVRNKRAEIVKGRGRAEIRVEAGMAGIFHPVSLRREDPVGFGIFHCVKIAGDHKRQLACGLACLLYDNTGAFLPGAFAFMVEMSVEMKKLAFRDIIVELRPRDYSREISAQPLLPAASGVSESHVVLVSRSLKRLLR